MRMKMSRAALGLASVLTALCCGPAKIDRCANAGCPYGLTCDPATGDCRRADAGASDAGLQCATTCSGAVPFCDPASLECVVCTVDQGCEGAKPFCDLNALHHRCTECRTALDCGDGRACNPSSQACEAPDAGPIDAGPHDAGGFDAGVDAGTKDGGAGDGGRTDGGGAGGGGGGDAGCIHHDGGNAGCTTECPVGFTCVNGNCQLRGSGGAVQVTLLWDQPEDLDLHVIEPLPDGGECEIFFGNTNNPPGGSTCGAVGSLDLDSNAGCSIDNVDIENVIYPPGRPPSGTYQVRVDYYSNCAATGPVPYEVRVRANGSTLGYCGSFQPADDDHGGAGSGVQVMSFVVP
jgi:hypothetical protein